MISSFSIFNKNLDDFKFDDKIEYNNENNKLFKPNYSIDKTNHNIENNPNVKCFESSTQTDTIQDYNQSLHNFSINCKNKEEINLPFKNEISRHKKSTKNENYITNIERIGKKKL